MGETLYLSAASDIEDLLLCEVDEGICVLGALVYSVDDVLGSKYQASRHVLINDYRRVFSDCGDTRNCGHYPREVLLRLLRGLEDVLAHYSVEHRDDIYFVAGEIHIQHYAVNRAVQRNIEMIRLENGRKFGHCAAVHEDGAKHRLLRVDIARDVDPREIILCHISPLLR